MIQFIIGFIIGFITVGVVKDYLQVRAAHAKAAEIRYTHWDIKALAHLLDRNSWIEFYQIPFEIRPDYTQHKVRESVSKAAKIFKAGFTVPWRSLMSEEDLEKWRAQTGWNEHLLAAINNK
jgi:hypothetical protein